MNADTLRRLKQAIKKWDGVINGSEVDRGALNCALCQKFIPFMCKGCPVMEATGQPYCSKTPYPAWFYSHRIRNMMTINTPRQRQLAIKERDFLKSLLPK